MIFDWTVLVKWKMLFVIYRRWNDTMSRERVWHREKVTDRETEKNREAKERERERDREEKRKKCRERKKEGRNEAVFSNLYYSDLLGVAGWGPSAFQYCGKRHRRTGPPLTGPGQKNFSLFPEKTLKAYEIKIHRPTVGYSLIPLVDTSIFLLWPVSIVPRCENRPSTTKTWISSLLLRTEKRKKMSRDDQKFPLRITFGVYITHDFSPNHKMFTWNIVEIDHITAKRELKLEWNFQSELIRRSVSRESRYPIVKIWKWVGHWK